MKKFVTLLAASSIAMTMAATALAKDTAAPGQICSGLTTIAKRNCMRGVINKKMEVKAEGKVSNAVRKFTQRQLKNLERERQRTGGTVNKTKTILTNKYYSSATSASKSSTSSAASSATSSSAGSATSGSASSATSSSASSN
ncbi:MAG: hypothetical protein HOO67_03220 [Candidatus Peribacteraceae bacterium]|nr:hypothetical protein [Candidatus Peribacteraceae bacterium]